METTQQLDRAVFLGSFPLRRKSGVSLLLIFQAPRTISTTI